MGKVATKTKSLFDKSSKQILLVGLDSAGKTTLLYRLKLRENIDTMPTIGFNVEETEPVKGLKLTIWDVGGQAKMRQIWENYARNIQGIIWMIDSNDSSRFAESKEELKNLLKIPACNSVPILILANKQDLPHAISKSRLVNILNLNSIENDYFITETCCLTGKGLTNAFLEFKKLLK